MPLHTLPHYLKTYRKRVGLSQDELAFLLGCQSGSKVCRYEQGTRIPNLETALAYEIALCTPLRELFAGFYTQRAQVIFGKAQELNDRLQRTTADSFTAQKLSHLHHIADCLSPLFPPNY